MRSMLLFAAVGVNVVAFVVVAELMLAGPVRRLLMLLSIAVDVVIMGAFLAGCSFQVPGNGLMAASPDMASPSGQLDAAPRVGDLARPPDLVIVRDLTPLPDLTPPLDMTPTPRYPAVQEILDRRGCTASACHQAYPPLVIPAPPPPAMLTAAQWKQNRDNVAAETQRTCDMASVADCAAASLLLVKPLGGSSATHAGPKAFASAGDPDYQTLLIWIEEGVRQ